VADTHLVLLLIPFAKSVVDDMQIVVVSACRYQMSSGRPRQTIELVGSNMVYFLRD
jgi:hypothetical protein